jgi:hypothetical protein
MRPAAFGLLDDLGQNLLLRSAKMRFGTANALAASPCGALLLFGGRRVAHDPLEVFGDIFR